MSDQATRRRFLKTAAAASAGVSVSASRLFGAEDSTKEKLNIGVIGCGGRGFKNLQGCSSERIVALCDVDEQRAKDAFSQFPGIARYRDYRLMLEKHRDLDAVIVSTPDHHHAPASVMAMRLGKHVYCEKPLSHSIHEARTMRRVAEECEVVTQMGNQGHADHHARQIVEMVRGGVIGTVHEVHAWTDRPGRFWKQPLDRPSERLAVPETLDWDQWLGPAPDRPYHSTYVPHDWRAWWDFGSGALGDMGCHVLDTAFWALDLGLPSTIEAETSGHHPETGPAWEVITYEFPARGPLPPIRLKWYDAGKTPSEELVGGQPLPESGSLLIGDKGRLYIPDAWGRVWRLLPEDDFIGYQPPDPTLPRVDSPYIEWIAACKGGPPALSRFEYSAVLSETVLLGVLAARLGKKINWDAENMRARDLPEADPYIRREYRSGWAL